MTVGFGVSARCPPERVSAAARLAEELGYRSFWVSHAVEGPNLAHVAHAARATVSMQLGVGVVPLSHGSAEEVGREVRRLKLPMGRLVVGVGSGTEVVGAPSVERVRKAVRTLKATLECEIVVGALGPRMCALAGEEADGALLTLVTAAYAKTSAEWMRRGAERAGRPLPKLYAYVRASLGAGAARTLVEEVEGYRAYPAFATHLARLGASPIRLGLAAGSSEVLKRRMSALADEFAEVVDELIIRAVKATERTTRCLSLIRAIAPGASAMWSRDASR